MTAITEEWLKEIGFKWFDVERSDKHWILWIGGAIAESPKNYRVNSYDDFGLEISRFRPAEDTYGVFFRADYAHRYTRFIFCREVWEQEQLIKLIESLTDEPFDKENIMYGTLHKAEQARRWREEENKRLDRQIAFGHKWRTDEPDDTKAVKK